MCIEGWPTASSCSCPTNSSDAGGPALEEEESVRVLGVTEHVVAEAPRLGPGPPHVGQRRLEQRVDGGAGALHAAGHDDLAHGRHPTATPGRACGRWRPEPARIAPGRARQ